MPSPGIFLVVEDHAPTARRVARVLSAYGGVEVAATANEGYRAATKPWLGLVVDYQLPGGNGLDVLRRARVTNPTAVAMLLTEHDDREIFTAGIELGAYFVPKPFRLKDLQAFAMRCLVVADGKNAVDFVTARLGGMVGLTEAEVEVLRLAVAGHERDEICRVRHVTSATLQTQIHGLCKKTGAHDLDHVVVRVFRDAFLLLSAQLRRATVYAR